MKQILFFVFFSLVFYSSYSQQAKGFLISDSQTNKKNYVKQGAEINIFTNAKKIKTSIDSISDTKLYTGVKDFEINDIDYIRYKDKNRVKKWIKILVIDALLSTLLYVAGLLLVDVFVYAFVIIAPGLLGLILLIPLFIIFLFILRGRKINFKK